MGIRNGPRLRDRVGSDSGWYLDAVGRRCCQLGRRAEISRRSTHGRTDEEDDLDKHRRRGHDLGQHLAVRAELGHEHERVREVLLRQRVDERVQVVAQRGSGADRAEHWADLVFTLALLLCGRTVRLWAWHELVLWH